MRIQRSHFFLLGSAVIAAIPFIMLPGANSTLADFAHADEAIVGSRIVEHSRGSRNYFELEVSTKSGRTYYLRQPDPGNLGRYLEALPDEGTLSIRYRKTFEGLLIVDIRDARTTYIDIGDHMADSRRKRFWILIAAFGFFAVGLLARRVERHSGNAGA